MPMLIVDADTPRRFETARLLAREFDGLRAEQAMSTEQAFDRLPNDAVDTVVLFDLGLPHALETIAKIVDTKAAIVVAVSPDEPRPTVMAAIRAGACSFIRATGWVGDLLPALRVVRDGRIWMPVTINERRASTRAGYGTWVPAPKQPADAGLSVRQALLLRLWVEGKPVARIAAALGSDEATVNAEQNTLQRQLDAASRLQLVLNVARMGLRLGIGHPADPPA